MKYVLLTMLLLGCSEPKEQFYKEFNREPAKPKVSQKDPPKPETGQEEPTLSTEESQAEMADIGREIKDREEEEQAAKEKQKKVAKKKKKKSRKKKKSSPKKTENEKLFTEFNAKTHMEKMWVLCHKNDPNNGALTWEGNPEACNELGVVAYRNGRLEVAGISFWNACKKGSRSGCLNNEMVRQRQIYEFQRQRSRYR